jgi:hypothetical protein
LFTVETQGGNLALSLSRATPKVSRTDQHSVSRTLDPSRLFPGRKSCAEEEPGDGTKGRDRCHNMKPQSYKCAPPRAALVLATPHRAPSCTMCSIDSHSLSMVPFFDTVQTPGSCIHIRLFTNTQHTSIQSAMSS